MLFAQKIIFVEGLAEEILIPTLAKYCGKNLEDHHVAVVPVGGRFFDNFLALFDTSNGYAIPKKVVCLKDRDPEQKENTESFYEGCYPYNFGQDTVNYTYRDHLATKIATYIPHNNIRFFGQNHPKGKTFEYELCLNNVESKILITKSISNKNELEDLLNMYAQSRPTADLLGRLGKSGPKKALKDAISTLVDPNWSEEDKKKAIIATRYLNSVGKGENALELANLLEVNLELPTTAPVGVATPVQQAFKVPYYIKKAILWICQ